MEHFEKQLKKGRKVHMSPDEKSVIRYSISKFIDTHKIPGAIIENPIHEPKVLRVSPFVYHSPFTYMRLLKGVTIVLIALLVGGSTLTYASEKALPGDALYTIKVNVKEVIEEKLATTTEAKAQYQVKRIQKRFEEIETLESTGELTPEKEAIVEKVFDSHAEALNQTLTTLENEGNQDAILETTAQLLPVLNDYSIATTEIETATDNQMEGVENNTEIGIDNLDETLEALPMMKSSLTTNTEDTEEMTDESDIKNKNIGDLNDVEKKEDNQSYKLAITFIQKIKKEKAHLEEHAEKSINDIQEDDKNTENKSIEDAIKSVDSLLNSINADLDRDISTAEEVSDNTTNDESGNEVDVDSTENNKTTNNMKVQIDNETNILVPIL